MRRLSVGLLGAVMGLAVLVAPVSTANAQQSPITIGIGVGGVFPTGDAGTVLNTGWLVDGHVAYRFAGGQSPVGLRFDLSYGSSSFKDFGVGAITSFEAKQNNIYGIAYAMLHPNIGQGGDKATLDIWVGGGGGFVNSKCSGVDCDAFGTTEDPTGTASSTDGALSGVVGGAAPIGGLYLFFEGRWVLIFTEGTSTNLFPVVFGVRIPLGG
ncbi:MAG: hypothetical protein O7E49_11290 [Gemmatimonadetes bacterium]|nr:hypothetical protein [Gemmatimonadota bacterium]